MRIGDPVAAPGQVIGLLGGSFDPPHAGHAHLSREAMKRLGLDRLWWLVSPGNPLKPRPHVPIVQRVVQARALLHDPRVVVTDIETRLGTRATVDTLAALQARYRGVRFVWVMGADNLAGFHRWDRWQTLLGQVPVAVFARPGARLPALMSRTARQFAHARLPQSAARRLGQMKPPAWVYLDIPLRPESSSAMRARGQLAGR